MSHTTDVTRREFAKSVAAWGATVGLANLEVPDLLANAGNDSGEAVPWAMIGTGSRGLELLRPLSKITTGSCVALCDNYPVNLKKGVETIGGSPATTDDYRRVLERKDVDAVLIATPLYLHCSMVLDALSAGKHVFIEKTMVFKEEEVKRMREAAAASPKLTLQVGLQRRYSLIYRAAIEMIRRGALGRVTHVRAHWNRNSDWRRPVADPKMERHINWRMYREYSGGLMAELGSHQMDVANWVFGAEPRSVAGFGGIDYWKDGRETYDNVQCLFEYPGGQKVIYNSMLNNAHYEFYEEIMGDQGTMEITLQGQSGKGTFWLEPKAKVSPAGIREQWWAGATVINEARQKTGLPVLPEEIRPGQVFIEPKDPVGVQLEHFFLCVRNGSKPLADVNIGLADAQAVIYSNRAMDENRRVFWPAYQQT